MTGGSLAALIINWNGAADTIELLESLVQCTTSAMKISCIVIDNNSTVADRALLASGLARLEQSIPISIRYNSVNIGVPAAYNQAIQIAGLHHDYYLRLDNDVIVDSEGLQAMIEILEKRSDVGLVGGNVKFYDSREKDNGGAVVIDLVRGKTSVSYPHADVVCDGVLGCIMLMSRNVVDRYSPDVFLGALFICTDESELSIRAARDGVLTMYSSRIIGYHKGGVSTKKVSFLSEYYSGRNWTYLRLLYVRGWRNRLITWFAIVMYFGLYALRLRGAHLYGVVAGVAMWLTSRIDAAVSSRKR